MVHITVQNTFQWLSGSKSDLNAVHLEILTILVRIIAWLSAAELFTRWIQEFGYNWLSARLIFVCQFGELVEATGSVLIRILSFTLFSRKKLVCPTFFLSCY